MNEHDVGFRLIATDGISGPASRAQHSLSSLGKEASTVSGGLGKMGQGALTAAKNMALLAVPVVLALGGIAVSATKAASSFQSAMTLIQTQAGGTAQEVTSMSAAVLKLAPAVGTGPEELAAGLYHVESAGLRGAKALEVLTIAAEGAKVGQADLEDTTNALIAANQSGVKGVQDMGSAMGTLNSIVGAGNMRMQDLTDAMGTGVLSTAKNYGVTIQSVGAALADMTDQGIPAVDAATRLNSAMRLMAAPTSKAVTELKSIGLSQFALATDMRGPGGIDAAIHDLKDHLDKSGLSLTQQAALIAEAFGGKQSGAILTLIGNVDLLDAKVAAVNQGSATFGDAWTATGETVAQQQANLSASFAALKIQLGNELLPVASNVLKALTNLVASPAVQDGIVSLGQGLAAMFSADNLTAATKFAEDTIPAIEGFAKDALPPFIAGLKLAGSIAKEAFDMFNALPEPLKAAIIGGLAVNKLSGGLLGSGLSDLVKVAANTVKGGGGGPLSVLGIGATHVFVDNWEMMRSGGGTPTVPGPTGPAGAAEDAAGAGGAGVAAGGAGFVATALPVALIAASVVATAAASYWFADQTGKQQAAEYKQIADYKALNTTQGQNVDALEGVVQAYRSQTADPLHSALTKTFAGDNVSQTLITAADKLANGTTINDAGMKAMSDAIGVAMDMGNQKLALAIQADMEKAAHLPQGNGDPTAQNSGPSAGGDPAAGGLRNTSNGSFSGSAFVQPAINKVVADKLEASMNHAATAAQRDAKAQLAGHLNATKAIKDADAIARVYSSGTATDTKWVGRNMEILRSLQQRFESQGDTATAGKLGDDLATLQAFLGKKMDAVVGAVGRIPGGTFSGSDFVNVGATVTARDVTNQQRVKGRYGGMVPQ